MKTRLTLLFIFIAALSHAQYDYDYDYDYYEDQPMFGLGIGYNLMSMVGDDVRPIEVSFRYRINSKNMLQLYMPFMRQNDDFHSKGHPDMELIDTSIDSKKRLYGVGLDYDYALHSFSSLDFVIGMRVEYQLYKYRTSLTNNIKGGTKVGEKNNTSELIYRNKKTHNYIFSPNAGLRFKLNRFAVDAKFLLSMLSTRGDVDNRVESKKHLESNVVSKTEEWSNHISNKFKLKPALMMSVSYFF